jgi:hypothetical protein
VVNQVDAAELRVVAAVVLAVTADAVLITKKNSQNLVPIWLPHWPVCMCAISREEAA